jgi:hypothetical protein
MIQVMRIAALHWVGWPAKSSYSAHSIRQALRAALSSEMAGMESVDTLSFESDHRPCVASMMPKRSRCLPPFSQLRLLN